MADMRFAPQEILLPVKGAHIALSLGAALMLNLLPWSGAWLWVKPDFVALVVLYWCVEQPRRVGFISAWVLGLLMDVGDGALFGQHALAYSILAYAGIGRPRKFFDSLAAIGATVARTVSFPDHHPFTAAEATRLLSEAKSGGFRLVTTEKDFARISAASGPLAELKAASEAFAVTIEFENPAAVSGLIAEAVRRHAAP